jgi:hypothetical protein
MNTPRTTLALSLSEVHQTLRPEPLTTEAELTAFYREEINYVRGDQIQRLAQGLKRALGGDPFKALLLGKRGVGKSTELSHMSRQLAEQFRVMRFSAVQDLNPHDLQLLDLFLMILITVAEGTSQSIEEGGAGQAPSEIVLQEIWDWFFPEKELLEQAMAKVITMKMGSAAPGESLWWPVSNVLTKLKTEITLTTSRHQEIRAARLQRFPVLVELVNRLFDNCNEIMRLNTGREWLLIGEDFDREIIPQSAIEDWFINHADIFRDLRSHLILTLPLALHYSSQSQQLPFTRNRCFVLADTPMFYPDRRPNMKGQWAIADVLAARILSSLFEAEQMERLIVAAGGDLRDLFVLVNYAADTADLRGATTMGADDAQQAIDHLRHDYERRLGQSSYDVDDVTYPEKIDRLLKIHQGDRSAQIPDAVTYSLLGVRALQDFDGDGWAVHPLVVDILGRQGLLAPSWNGAVAVGVN